MLEIGALKPDNYASYSKWILNTPIDLRSNHPDILEQDFLLRPLPKNETDRFDVISCSLVINFVPDIRDRGEIPSPFSTDAEVECYSCAESTSDQFRPRSFSLSCPYPAWLILDT